MAAVFAYGSLIAPATIAALAGRPVTAGRDHLRARLTGWSRTWNVCTDNTADGPVAYEDPVDGTRPPIQVLANRSAARPATAAPTTEATVIGVNHSPLTSGFMARMS